MSQFSIVQFVWRNIWNFQKFKIYFVGDDNLSFNVKTKSNVLFSKFFVSSKSIFQFDRIFISANPWRYLIWPKYRIGRIQFVLCFFQLHTWNFHLIFKIRNFILSIKNFWLNSDLFYIALILQLIRFSDVCWYVPSSFICQ